MVPSSFSTLKTKNTTQINEMQEKNSPASSIVCNNITTSNSEIIRGEKEHQNCSRIFPLICREFSTKSETSKPNSVLSTRNSKSLLFHYFSTIVHFISISLQPNQKASRRMAGIEFLEHLFTLLTYELPERSIRSENIPEQFNHYCCGRKIMSYAIRDNIRENNFHGNFDGENFYTCDHDEVYKNLCGVCCEGVEVALSALSDASDAVCAAALTALYASVPLIMQDQIKVRRIPFYSIQFYSILLYSILFYSILFYSILFYSILFYSILFYSILFYSSLFDSIQFYSIFLYLILFYSSLFDSIPNNINN
jgi:hypothetical protein